MRRGELPDSLAADTQVNYTLRDARKESLRVESDTFTGRQTAPQRKQERSVPKVMLLGATQ